MNEKFVKISLDFFNCIHNSYMQQIYIYLRANVNIAGYCSRSYRNIAKNVGISVSEAKKIIKKMAEDNIIRKETVRDAKGANSPNNYYLLDLPEFWKADFSQRMSFFCPGINSNAAPAGAFVKVSHSLLSADLSCHEKTIYMCLKRFFNARTKECFPSLKKIAAHTGLCVKTVCKYLQKLADKKIIKKWSYYSTSTGKRCSCRYKLYNVFPQPAGVNITEEAGNTATENEQSFSQKHRPGIYTIEEIRDYYCYDYLITEVENLRLPRRLLDATLNIIKKYMNQTKDEYISGNYISAETIKSELSKLGPDMIIRVMQTYYDVNVPIKNTNKYILSMLLNAYHDTVLKEINIVNNILFAED